MSCSHVALKQHCEVGAACGLLCLASCCHLVTSRALPCDVLAIVSALSRNQSRKLLLGERRALPSILWFAVRNAFFRLWALSQRWLDSLLRGSLLLVAGSVSFFYIFHWPLRAALQVTPELSRLKHFTAVTTAQPRWARAQGTAELGSSAPALVTAPSGVGHWRAQRGLCLPPGHWQAW